MTLVEQTPSVGERVDLNQLREFHPGRPHDCKQATDIYWLGLNPAVDEFDRTYFRSQIEEQPNLDGGFEPKPGEDIDRYVTRMWDTLWHGPGVTAGGRLPTPNGVFVPGERFTESYYWDTLDVMRGLAADGRWDDIRDQVDNFVDLLDEYGYIPNGTREYFLGRSQPPVFAEMVELLAQHDGDEVLVQYLPALQREHNFWMAGAEQLRPGETGAAGRVVGLDNGRGGSLLLNRYFSDLTGPRPESICKDDATIARAVAELGADPDRVSLDLRAACESGWDFSSRWLADGRNLHTIRTTDILPVDLNCNMLKLEQVLAKAYYLAGERQLGAEYAQLAADRSRAIRQVFWDESEGFAFDYNFAQGRRTGIWSLAGVYPVDFGVIGGKQASRVMSHVEQKFLQPGGCLASLSDTDEQWDGRNGWGLLQFRATRAAWRSGHHHLAETIRANFMGACEKAFARKGRMYEKVDVRNPGQPGNEGEYACQIGFGMTNGAYKALRHGLYRRGPLRGEGHVRPLVNVGRAAGARAVTASGVAGS